MCDMNGDCFFFGVCVCVVGELNSDGFFCVCVCWFVRFFWGVYVYVSWC